MPIRHHALTPEELGFYRAHGYLIREHVFDADEVERLRVSVEAAVEKAYEQTSRGKTYFLDRKRFVDVDDMTVQFEHSEASETIRVIEPVQHLNADIDSLICDPRIVDPVKDIIGVPEVSVWTNKLNLKRAGEGSGFGWHQDSPYWVHDSDHVDLLPNVYVAFDDASKENGCLQIIDRSHKNGCLPGIDNGTQLGGFFTDPNCFSETDAVPIVMTAGSIAFFDAHAIHGSKANHSDQARRAMVMTYQPAGFPMLKTGKVYNISARS